MPGPVFLHTDDEAVTLRTVEEANLPFLQRNSNDPAVRRLLRSPTPRNGKQMQESFEERTSSEDSVSLLVRAEGDEEPEPVGSVALFRIDEQAGVATLATETMVDHTFDDRRLHKVVGEAYAHNTASRRVLGKVGLRDEKFVGGDHVDIHRFGLLADER